MQQRGFPGFEAAPPRDSHQLFFALWPDDDVRARLAGTADTLRQAHATRGRWIKPHRYHLTVQYLGAWAEPPPAVLEHASRAAQRVAAPAFELALDVAGSFANRSIPWWLGCTRAPAALARLAHALDASLREVAAADAKPLVPHVTIVRDAERELPPTPIAPVRWPVREFVLIDSRLGARSEYALLGRWPLRGEHG